MLNLDLLLALFYAIHDLFHLLLMSILWYAFAISHEDVRWRLTLWFCARVPHFINHMAIYNKFSMCFDPCIWLLWINMAILLNKLNLTHKRLLRVYIQSFNQPLPISLRLSIQSCCLLNSKV